MGNFVAAAGEPGQNQENTGRNVGFTGLFVVSPAKVGHLQAIIKDLSAKLNDGRTIFRLSVTSSALSVIILIYRFLFNFIGQFLHYFGHF
ncbi:hypothetical protein LIS77_04445 [Cytobacillus firmus]|uniref:hypothetical protein n=1 Tax=Cytobacillus firmus TaxID=1399 RepID=UPI002079428B|nr:hypothetical protein [Cytobacillus firmus]USK39787.1 hypothetical protein LIS77_04445 [Cytobacillus firmus]